MKLCTDSVFFSFSKDAQPALRVSAGATLDIEALDCFSNQLRRESDNIDQLDWDRINPATGPVYVEGAEPGDALKVSVNSITLDGRGTVCCLPGEGVLGHMLSEASLRVADIKDGFCHYLDRPPIPLRPMIGVIGVAPANGAVNTGTPGPHGGNMDNTMITAGATLYLPVFHRGALFGLGDLHAVMGDGEIGVSGLETPAVVNLTLEVLKGRAPACPVLENADSFAMVASKPTTDQAITHAAELMCEFLEQRIALPRADIIMLMSLVGDVQICQVVDPEKTVRFVFPKKYLDKPEF